MSQSTLRRVLTIFENTQEPLSLPQIARTLDVSPERLDAMITYWIRKGKIRVSGALTDCGTCSSSGACPFVMTLPRTYELVTADPVHIPLEAIGTPCGHAPMAGSASVTDLPPHNGGVLNGMHGDCRHCCETTSGETHMARELCKQKKSLKDEPRTYMKLVNQPTHVCTKCGRAANSKKLLCSPTRIQA